MKSVIEGNSSSSSCLMLLCDEELNLPTSSQAQHPAKLSSVSDASDEDRDRAFTNYLLRERSYAPKPGYTEHLHQSSDQSSARSKAVRLILLSCARLNLAIGTAFNAVNYLDRFISRDCCVRWEAWMIELLCIACLSIASKLDEVFIPSLHDFQIEGLEHSFQTSTIQQMELAVLEALDWRLSCVTPYSYVELLMFDAALSARITGFLLRSLIDTRFVEYSASSIAATALRCAALHEELVPLNRSALMSILARLMPKEHTLEMDKCQKIMEEQVACPWKYKVPSNPVIVAPLQRAGILDCNISINRCFFGSPSPNLDLKKPKREEDVGNSGQLTAVLEC